MSISRFAVLDVELAGINGFEATRRIRRFSNTYVIMVSARNEGSDTLMGLVAGADDYPTKPFRPRELRARIDAMLRRSRRQQVPIVRGPADPSTTATGPPAQAAAPEDGDAVWLHHYGLRRRPGRRICVVDGIPVELTRREYNLLLALVKAWRRVITKHSLASRARQQHRFRGHPRCRVKRMEPTGAVLVRRPPDSHLYRGWGGTG